MQIREWSSASCAWGQPSLHLCSPLPLFPYTGWASPCQGQWGGCHSTVASQPLCNLHLLHNMQILCILRLMQYFPFAFLPLPASLKPERLCFYFLGIETVIFRAQEEAQVLGTRVSSYGDHPSSKKINAIRLHRDESEKGHFRTTFQLFVEELCTDRSHHTDVSY